MATRWSRIWLELGVGGEAGRRGPGRRRSAASRRATSALRSEIWLLGDDQQRHPEQRRRPGRRSRCRRRGPLRIGRAFATTLFARDQVYGAHRLVSFRASPNGSVRRAADAASRSASAWGRPIAKGRPSDGLQMRSTSREERCRGRRGRPARPGPLRPGRRRSRARGAARRAARRRRLSSVRAGFADDLGSPSIASSGWARPTWFSHMRACSSVRPGGRGEVGDDVLEPERGDAGEEARLALRDGEVGDVADVAVEGGRSTAVDGLRRRPARGRPPGRRGRGSGRRRRGRLRPA